ncbi:VWA domain-containing protein [Bacillus sp. HMF5848]|uniref:vWA domain-containing protein n=1 Tax=Bacillus sp. HMF5848 TaxID=2495421 RepID=UPI000F79DA43|nr:VWA domain-containing protein [Bacillus sp. HMF5848]RSK28284.1 VWA domain-containing protein [Bacillus sp. HMF5848]
MKYIKFNDKQVDSFLFMELTDLAEGLARDPQLEIEYAYQSYYNQLAHKITISRFWDDHVVDVKRYGLMSDILLRSAGSMMHSDFKEIKSFIKKTNKLKFPNIAKQLLMLLEDIRLEDAVVKERPGTKRVFKTRRVAYRKYFKSQLNTNLIRSVYTDALYCTVYLLVTAESPLEDIPPIQDKIDRVLPYIRSELVHVYEANSTKAIVSIVLRVMEVLDEILERDMLNLYFFLPEHVYSEDKLIFEDLKRRDRLRNNDLLEDVKNGDEDVHDEEKMPMWHRETESPTKSFLQFDLEQGTKTDLMGEGVREGEDGDQALGMVQGSSQQSSRNDFAKMEALEAERDEKKASAVDQYGKENRQAIAIFLKPDIQTNEQKRLYTQYKAEISPYQKKLKQMIQKTLEHKKILPRHDLHIGRLSKQLTKFFVDENPRMFYKKNQPSPEIDAAFGLLVDCSASMYDKMEQTKLGITLFHEALKSVQVPHSIVGFWEDTGDASEEKQPNYFKKVVDFATFKDDRVGPNIMQLEPEEDNRDGFAIRHMIEVLLTRQEKQKFLLVFSDGEPAAFGYEQNGIVDTHEAVVEARKHGIEIINVFLANGEISEGQQNTIRNIYGKYSILVPHIEELPDVLFPLLKKLLLKSL